MNDPEDLGLVLFSSAQLDELIEPDTPVRTARQLGKDDHVKQLAIISAEFPRISKAITARWGEPEFYSYMDTIMFSDRSDRAGFPEHVGLALSHLLTIHRKLFAADPDTPDPVTGQPKANINWST